jgi:hypothetical protein
MMTAFLGLVKKDMMLMRFWYVVWLVFTLISMAGGFIISKWLSELSVIVPVYIMLMGLQLFLMPIMLSTALRIEGKSQLWLYNPQSSKKLLLAKLSAVSIFQGGSQLILALYGLVMAKILVEKGVISSFSDFLPLKQGFFIHLGIFSMSAYMCFWIMFLWTVYHSFGRYSAIKNFRWLVVILVCGTYNVFEAFLFKLKVIKEPLFTFTVKYESGRGWTIPYTEVSLPIVPIIVYSLISIALFLIASRLLDKKVEV